MSYIFSALEYGSLAVQSVLLVLLLLSGNFRRYALLLVYVLLYLITGSAELIVLHNLGNQSPTYRVLFYADEVIIDLLLFLMVIALTYRALGESPLRGKIGRVLAVVVIAVILLPFVLFQGPLFSARWFNKTSQMLNFGGAIMNLALWTALAGNKKRDARLLIVSAGLGIAVTAAAIAYGLMTFRWGRSGVTGELVALFKSTANVLGLIIWCWGFWPASKPQRAPRPLTSP